MSLRVEKVRRDVLFRGEDSLDNPKSQARHAIATQQKGQAMILGLVLCGVGVLAWLAMLELGQRVHDQSSLHRATDAAVYSAALMQARALNLHAYLNRAHIAHQIGMAHLIAAATASQYRDKLAHQALRRNPPPSLMGAFFGPQHAVAYMAALSGGIGDAHSQNTFRQAFLRHEKHVHQILDRVRQLQIRNADLQREQAMHRMLIANVGQSGGAIKGDTLQQLGLSLALTLDESKGFVTQLSANNTVWRDFLTGLVDQYGFLSERNQTHRNVWLVNPRCPLKRHELRRRGRLQLGRDGHWLSDETLSFHALRHNKMIGCYHREYPMGWAVLKTQRDRQTVGQDAVVLPEFSRQVFWRWSLAQRAGRWNILRGHQNLLAQRYGQSASIKWSSKGLGRYVQITPARESKPLRVAIKVSQKLATSEIHSVATAQTYYSPPKDDPHRSRSPSLFEPYWRATLVPNEQQR